MYKEGLNPSGIKIKKIFNNGIKKEEEYKWLYDVSAQITAQAFTDLQTSFDGFLVKNLNIQGLNPKEDPENLSMFDMTL